MEHKKLLILIVSILMVLLVPIILYGSNFNSVAFDEEFYKKEFLKYNVYDNLENYNIEDINNDVLNYLKTNKNNELIKSDFFNDREKSHLLDVKNLIQKISTLYYFSIILFFLLFILLTISMNFKIEKIVKKLLLILLFGGFFTLLDTVIVIILSKFNFDFIFDLFHKTFFVSGTYLFNPEFENIVVLYPYNLFFDSILRIVSTTILSSIILLFFSIAALFFFFKSNFSKSFTKNTDGKNNK